MHTIHQLRAGAAVSVCCALAAGCDSFLTAGGPPALLVPTTAVLLRIENQSGIAAEVDVTYMQADLPVRTTNRRLAANGPETSDLIVWTSADEITIRAAISATADLAGDDGTLVGELLAEGELRRGVDYAGGETLTFVIPAPEPPAPESPDCNGNGVGDLLDIGSETSADCDANGVPDECDPDFDADGIPDACDAATCTSCEGDVNGDGDVDADDLRDFVACQIAVSADDPCACADLDGDGIVGEVDEAMLVATLLDGPGPCP
jgi:hypothetical protein